MNVVGDVVGGVLILIGAGTVGWWLGGVCFWVWRVTKDRREEAASGTGGRDNEGGATSVVEAPSAAPDPPIAAEINWNPSWLMDRLLDAANAAAAHTEVVRRPGEIDDHEVVIHTGWRYTEAGWERIT